MTTTRPPYVDASGYTTAWLPFTTAGPSLPAGCSSAFYLQDSYLEHEIIAFDPMVKRIMPDALLCLPPEMYESWSQTGNPSTSLGAFHCPSAFTTATTTSINDQLISVVCCPSQYDYVTVQAANRVIMQCHSSFTGGKLVAKASVVADGDTSYSWTDTTITAASTVLGIQISGYMFSSAVQTDAAASTTISSQAITTTLTPAVQVNVLEQATNTSPSSQITSASSVLTTSLQTFKSTASATSSSVSSALANDTNTSSSGLTRLAKTCIIVASLFLLFLILVIALLCLRRRRQQNQQQQKQSQSHSQSQKPLPTKSQKWNPFTTFKTKPTTPKPNLPTHHPETTQTQKWPSIPASLIFAKKRKRRRKQQTDSETGLTSPASPLKDLPSLPTPTTTSPPQSISREESISSMNSTTRLGTHRVPLSRLNTTSRISVRSGSGGIGGQMETNGLAAGGGFSPSILNEKMCLSPLSVRSKTSSKSGGGGGGGGGNNSPRKSRFGIGHVGDNLGSPKTKYSSTPFGDKGVVGEKRGSPGVGVDDETPGSLVDYQSALPPFWQSNGGGEMGEGAVEGRRSRLERLGVCVIEMEGSAPPVEVEGSVVPVGGLGYVGEMEGDVGSMVERKKGEEELEVGVGEGIEVHEDAGGVVESGLEIDLERGDRSGGVRREGVGGSGIGRRNRDTWFGGGRVQELDAGDCRTELSIHRNQSL